MTLEDLHKLVPQENLTEFAAEFLMEFLKDGFGSATKRDTELHVFYLLERHGQNIGLKDNLDLSHLLKITDSRVKSYRYESKLRFPPPKEDKFVERRFLWALARSQFDSESKRIKFTIEDTYVRKTLIGIAKRLGGVPDSSFNSEIVVLKIDQLLELIADQISQDIAEEYKPEFEKLVEGDSKIKFKELKKKFVEGAASKLGGWLLDAVKGYFTSGVA